MVSPLLPGQSNAIVSPFRASSNVMFGADSGDTGEKKTKRQKKTGGDTYQASARLKRPENATPPAGDGDGTKKTGDRQGVDPAQTSDAPPQPPKSDPPNGADANKTNNPPPNNGNGAGRKYGYLENNTREALKVLLADIIPLALGFVSVSGPWGIALAVAGLPLAWMSGKIGRAIGKGVDGDNLVGVLKLKHQITDAINNGIKVDEKGNITSNVTENINSATSDFIGSLKLPGLVKTWLQGKVLLKAEGGMGKFLNNFALLKADVYSDVAKQDTLAGAGRAVAKGGWTWLVYFKILPAVGKMLQAVAAMPWVPFKGAIKVAAEGLEHAYVLKMAKEGLGAMFKADAAQAAEHARKKQGGGDGDNGGQNGGSGGSQAA